MAEQTPPEPDRIVLPHIQRQIINAYTGPLKIFNMLDADHDTPLMENDFEQLRPMASWLYDAVTH